MEKRQTSEFMITNFREGVFSHNRDGRILNITCIGEPDNIMRIYYGASVSPYGDNFICEVSYFNNPNYDEEAENMKSNSVVRFTQVISYSDGENELQHVFLVLLNSMENYEHEDEGDIPDEALDKIQGRKGMIKFDALLDYFLDLNTKIKYWTVIPKRA
jgi:hypothetical protein